MASNVREFDLGVKEWQEETAPSLIRDRVSAIGLGMLESVMKDTPVDTGRMKGNWQLSISSPAEGDIDRSDKSAKGTVGPVFAEEAGKLAAPRDPFEQIWIHNGLEYASYVNDGTETQAAQRIVERTFARFERTAGSAG